MHALSEDKVNLDQFFSSAITLAKQAEEGQKIKEAFQQGHISSANYRYEAPKEYIQYLRFLVQRSVFARWTRERTPSTLAQIYRDVLVFIQAEVDSEKWPTTWLSKPSKRTVDRRVNESADSKYFPDRETPLICLIAGVYSPSPRKFTEESRSRLMEVIGSYSK